MKRLIIIMCTLSTLIVAQDAAGQYKLSGVDVLYTFVARGETGLTVTDAYGFGVTVEIAKIPDGAPFTTQAMQLTDAALSAVGINLNVTLNEDGSGSIAEGSYYPDVNTITDDDGNCVTLQQVLPVTDDFTYSSMGNGMAAVGFAHPGVNVLGLPGISSYAGQQLGLLGLSGSNTFEDYPMIPEQPTMCGPDGNCGNFTVGDIDGSGTVEIYPDVNLLGIPEYVPGGYPLTGVTGGYFLKEGLNADDIPSVFPGNTDPNFHLEWHGVDGASSGLGYGDDEESDEDEDGTWYDREIGIPSATATYMNPACGFNQPIFGDVSAAFEAQGLGDCVDGVGDAVSAYLMDPSGNSATWGNFVTARAALYQQCLGYEAYGVLPAGTCNALGGGILLQDDSAFDVDPTCLADYTPGNFEALLDCAGRLVMNFDIPCVPIIEAREVVAEFIEVGGGDCGTGDINFDGANNVLDVVALVNCVLSASCEGCAGDMNIDGVNNVLDVVALVNCVLSNSCGSRVDEATSAEFNVIENEVTMTADGFVGGIQMTLSHGNDFTMTLTDGGEFSDYLTRGNTTTLMIVNPTNDNLFTTNGDFNIETVIATANGSSYMNTSVNMLESFSVTAAYPNPFNPTTQMSVTLNASADVSVKVFNMNGQIVDVIASGNMSSGTYNFAWDGTNAASGIYFIQTEVGSQVNSQKIMLVK